MVRQYLLYHENIDFPVGIDYTGELNGLQLWVATIAMHWHLFLYLQAYGNKRHWILELHFVDRANNIGAFFEQLLVAE